MNQNKYPFNKIMSNMKNKIICICLLLLSGIAISVNAQNSEIKGKVIDAVTKMPLSGIMVQTLHNDIYIAMTGADGSFVIKAPEYSTALYVHAPEYISQQIAINKKGETVVKLLSDKFAKMYDNTTNIVAERTMTLKNTTSKTIESDIEDNLNANVRTVTRSGAAGIGANMFIRGLNSLTSSSQPLIILDGIIQDLQTNRKALHQGDFNNYMLNINPEDIESVQVLKNATAIYGAKGANGVIIINTKRGRSMATRIDANIGVGVELVPRLPKVMNAQQYKLYASDMLGTYPEINRYTGTFNFLNEDTNSYYYNLYHNDTDWSKETYHSALTQNYNINVQGGDDIGMYNLSLGYTDAQSTAKKNGFDRLNVRFNTDIKIIKKLTTKFDMSLTKINRDVFDDGAMSDFTKGTVTSPTFLAMIKSPILNPYMWNSYTNSFSSTLSDADDFLAGLDGNLSLANPTAIIAKNHGYGNNRNHVENTMFNVSLSPTFKFNNNLKLTESACYTLNRNSQRYYRPVYGVPSYDIYGIGTVQKGAKSLSAKEIDLMSDTRLSYSKVFGKHNLEAFGGVRYCYYDYSADQPEGQNGTGGSDKNPNINNMDYYKTYGADETWKNITWYAQADYNYLNRYFLEASLSLDASSRFGDDAKGLNLFGVKWGVFPGVQAGWVLSNESWFPKTDAFNYLKLSAGVDFSGNDDINYYASRSAFNTIKYLYSKGNSTIGAQLNQLGNDKIQYEQTRKFNIELESNMLYNRMSFTFDFYFNHTWNLLTHKTMDTPIAGITNYWMNGGALNNTGFEVNLSGKPIISKNLNVEVGASLGHYRNKIKDLREVTNLTIDGNRTVVGYTSSIYGTDNIATIVGKSAGVFYGYKSLGVFSTDAEAKAAGQNGYLKKVDNAGAETYFKAGDIHFADLNGDGIINENDKTIIGNPNPDVYGNIFAKITWKAFTLNLGFNYCLGNDVFNYERSVLEGESNFYNQTTAVTNHWSYEGQVTNQPRLVYGDPMSNSRFSDRWIEDGSYLRLRTLSLSYKLPMRSTSFLQGLAVWAEANNLFTITHYLGSDPEFSAASGVLYQGIDTGCTAMGRAFTMGIKVNL